MATATPQPAPSTQDPSPAPQQLSWEGDRMFNIYIYDYCHKRGFRKTARELLLEADIPADSQPPINARQGLLFEWWSVFWVLFTAKSSGTGSDDAMLYTQHQGQAAQRVAGMRMAPTSQISRFPNGVPRSNPGILPPNGSMPNGIGHPTAPHPGIPGGPMSAGALHGAQPAMGFPMGGHSQQPPPPQPQQNGIPAQGAPPPNAQAPPQSHNPQSQPLSGQRPQMGGPQQPRGPPNGLPFQSPTMANSPQNPGAPGSMGSQMGPSPHLTHMARGGMHPPQGMHNPGSLGSEAATPTTATFGQVGRPPSRTATPSTAGGAITHPSPSMAARQPPATTVTGGSDVRAMQLENVNHEITRIPKHVLNPLKQELGLGDKDLLTMTLEEKQHVVTMSKKQQQPASQPLQQAPNSRNSKQGPSQAGPSNAVAGPSGMPVPNTRNPPRGSNKRNSTSPGEEHETLPKSESSPPANKRPRRSPNVPEQQQQQQQQPQPNPMTPFPNALVGPGPGGPPQQMPNGMMRPGPHMNGFPQQGMPNMGHPGMNIPMGQGIPPHMANAMNPGMMNHPGQGPPNQQMHPQQMMQMQQQQREQHYRMHAIHKGGAPPGSNMTPGANAGSPAADQSFNMDGNRQPFPGGGMSHPGLGPGPGPANNRLAQGKPMGMLPPPSPASKGQNGSPGKEGAADGQQSGTRPDASPHPAHSSTPGQGPPGPPPMLSSQTGTGSSTPAPGPNHPGPAPSPSAIITNRIPTPSTTMSNGPPSAEQMSGSLFSTEFIDSVAFGAPFTNDLFPDDINFERDFGQWFTADDVINPPVDMK